MIYWYKLLLDVALSFCDSDNILLLILNLLHNYQFEMDIHSVVFVCIELSSGNILYLWVKLDINSIHFISSYAHFMP